MLSPPTAPADAHPPPHLPASVPPRFDFDNDGDDANRRRGPMKRRARAAGLMPLTWVLATLAGGCTPQDDVIPTLRAVSLPDLSRLAESVQDQVRERHALLMETREERGTPPVELGNAYGELGLILMAAEYYEAAASCYLNAQALAPDVMRWPYYLGHLYRIKGDGAKAAEGFARAVELRPTDLAPLVWLGETYLDQSRPDAAERIFIQALSLEPRSATALSGVGRIALARQDTARAVEYLERALSVLPQASSLHYPLAMAYRRLGELDKADAHLRRRGTGMPSAPDPLMEAYSGLLRSTMTYEARGLRALEAGRLAAAEELFRTGLELAPDDPALRHRLATALFMAGDARGAEEQFEETLRRSPEFAKAHFGLGMILDLSGRHQEAAERFSAAVTSQPDYLEARLGLADALRVTGRAEESLPHYEEIVRTDPGFAEAWIGSAMALAHLERYQEARDRLTEARTVLPDRPELADLLAQLPSY